MNESTTEFNGKTFTFSNNYPPTLEAGVDNGEDFILTGEHAWIRAGNFSIRINDCGNFAKVGVWKFGNESNNPIDEIKVYQDDE